jgi:hypothetical protein
MEVPYSVELSWVDCSVEEVVLEEVQMEAEVEASVEECRVAVELPADGRLVSSR